MGTSQSPDWFVRVINEVINNIGGVEAYLDDVVAFDETPKMHVHTIQTFPQGREEVQHQTLSTKGDDRYRSLGFSGKHLITPDGLCPRAENVEALTKMPMATTVKQLRSPLGGLSYRRSFLSKNQSKRTKFITGILKEAPLRAHQRNRNNGPRTTVPLPPTHHFYFGTS